MAAATLVGGCGWLEGLDFMMACTYQGCCNGEVLVDESIELLP